MRIKFPEMALRTSVVYVLLGGVWIFLSDIILDALFSDEATRAIFQIYKGWLFVSVTGVLLYVALRRQLLCRDKDATLRKNAIVDLQESERRYRLVAENVSDVIWVLDLSTMRLQYVSPSVARLLGCTAEELMYQGLSLLLTEDSRREFTMKLVGRLARFAEGESGEYVDEVEHPRKDGTRVWTETLTRIVANSAVGHNELYGASRDITERRAMEAGLKEKVKLQEQIEKVAASVPGMIFSLRMDPEGRLCMPYASPMIKEIYGLEPKDVADDITPFISLIDADDKERVAAGIAESAKTMTPWHDEYRLHHPQKGEIWIEGMSMPQREPDGSILWHGFVADITDRKRAEEQLRASLHEKEVLLKEVHHRVRNNLQVISSLMSIQADHMNNPESQSAFRDSRFRVRAMALVHEKLYSSGNLASVQFGDYIESVVNELLRSFGKQGLTVSLDLDPIFLEVDKAIPSGLIVGELVMNVLKHAFPGESHGTLTVALHRVSASTVALTVADNGIGFPKGEDFKTMSSMGMTLLMALVQQVSGTVSLDRAGGTRFAVEFPG
jgi:PAS domain S-box-containing protein